MKYEWNQYVEDYKGFLLLNFSKNGEEVDMDLLSKSESNLWFFNKVKYEIGRIKTTGGDNSNNNNNNSTNKRSRCNKRNGSNKLKAINKQKNNSTGGNQRKTNRRKRTFETFNNNNNNKDNYTSNKNKKRKIKEISEWNCQQCTFLNNAERTRCKICKAQKPGTFVLVQEYEPSSRRSNKNNNKTTTKRMNQSRISTSRNVNHGVSLQDSDDI